MGKLFKGMYAPSTLGSFLRHFTFGHVRQLDAAAGRWLVNLAAAAPITAGIDELALVDIDDTIKATIGYQKQGACYGYSGVKGLNALIGTVTTNDTAPIIAGARLRKGAANSARGAAKLVADLLAAVGRLRSPDAGGMMLLRADSAYYAHSVAVAEARVSLTVRMDPAVKRAIAAIPADAWEKIKYTNSIFDEETGTWVSVAEVAETVFTAFTSKKRAGRITGRLVVRRIPELNPRPAKARARF